MRPTLAADRAPRPRAGNALVAALFWAFGLALLGLPFLRDRSAPDPEGDDPARALSELDIPFDEDVATWADEFGEDLRGPLEEASERWFGPDAAVFGPDGLLDAARVSAGQAAYEKHCISCHGSIGDGAGPGARYLKPRPRNFRKGVFKFTSTPTGARPRPEDLMRTIRDGLAGSAMPTFRLLSEELRWDLVEYVRFVAMRGEFEQLALDDAWDAEELPDFDDLAEIVLQRWSEEATSTAYPEAPEGPDDAASIARGKELYMGTDANCHSCHGETGLGDGPSAKEFLDDWGYPIQPRDLTTGVYRAGSAPADLYRSISNGIKGTPMPSFDGSIPPEGIWDLVHFVKSLSEAD